MQSPTQGRRRQAAGCNHHKHHPVRSQRRARLPDQHDRHRHTQRPTAPTRAPHPELVRRERLTPIDARSVLWLDPCIRPSTPLMKLPRIPLFLLSLCLALSPTVHADDMTPLDEQMEMMGDAFKVVRRQVSDASANASTLEHLAEIRAAAEKSLEFSPAYAAEKSDDGKN